MRSLIFLAIFIVAMGIAGAHSTKVSNTRDYQYEAYCDSIWESNPDYYMDVIAESDEYCEYLDKHGKWWE